MYTGVAPDSSDNIEAAGYIINAATPLSYTPTPTFIPGLVGESSNVYTTLDIVCAFATTTQLGGVLYLLNKEMSVQYKIRCILRHQFDASIQYHTTGANSMACIALTLPIA